MQMPPDTARKVSCREIAGADLLAVAKHLAQGFPGRSVAHWCRGFERQTTRDLPTDVPRYGYLLESEGRIVGALLVIYSNACSKTGENFLRCNLSSWFVDPSFRSYATLLTSIAQKNRSVTFVNLTPAPNTWPIIEAQGFREAGKGLFVCCPILTRFGSEGRLQIVHADTASIQGLDDAELVRLTRHAALGCLSIVCHTDEGPVPFIMKPFRIRRGRVPVPAMQLIYAPTLEAYRNCAGLLGRYFALRGRLFIVLNAEAPITGLAGFFTMRRGRRYVRGPHPPSLCDLTDSEIVIFGR